MFNPSQEDVRHFFCDAFRKAQTQEILTPLENIAAHWINLHPEYHADFSDAQEAVEKQYPVESGTTNPFLHLSMHLTITEQIQANQPIGIQAIYENLLNKKASAHDVQHLMMDCLGEIIWQAQRNQKPLDSQTYLNLLKAIK